MVAVDSESSAARFDNTQEVNGMCRTSKCRCGGGCRCGCCESCGCGCRCSCSGEGGFKRRYQTKAERITELEQYLKDLKTEVQAVREKLGDLKRKK